MVLASAGAGLVLRPDRAARGGYGQVIYRMYTTRVHSEGTRVLSGGREGVHLWVWQEETGVIHLPALASVVASGSFAEAVCGLPRVDIHSFSEARKISRDDLAASSLSPHGGRSPALSS